MEALKILTMKDVLDFFANSAIEKISLFAFFVIITILFLNSRKDRRDFANDCKSLETEISKLSKALTKNIAADEEMSRKHMREFKHLGDSVTLLTNNIGLLRTDIVKLHNYCMGKNGYPSQTGGSNNDNR